MVWTGLLLLAGKVSAEEWKDLNVFQVNREAPHAMAMADRLLEKGIYVVGFSFPVVPKGQARIRVQISAAHSIEDLDYAVEQFAETMKELG